MASVNQKSPPAPGSKTFENTAAMILKPEQALHRAIASCLLWEDQFYENGIAIADRIKDLTLTVAPGFAAGLAVDAREKFKLRHAPLWIARALASGSPVQRATVASLLERIIQRPDELTEFVALYWKDGRQPLSAGVKKGLARAFRKFDAYALGKYNRTDEAIKLRDVLFLSHAKPKDEAQAAVWKQLVDGTLATPDTWEVALSATKGENKHAEWVRLLTEKKLGSLALLRNLRNMRDADVPESLVRTAINEMKVDRVLPFRFLTAAKYAPRLEDVLEKAMFRCLEGAPKLPGRTALIVDTSPSMWQAKVSQKSEMDRFEAAAALAILCRELCETVDVYTFNERAYAVPPRRGFALRDAMAQTQGSASCGGLAVEAANKAGYDRIVVLTDGEWHSYSNGRFDNRFSGNAADVIPDPLPGSKAYLINVASYRNAVGTKRWTMIDGWSEAIFSYVGAVEGQQIEAVEVG